MSTSYRAIAWRVIDTSMVGRPNTWEVEEILPGENADGTLGVLGEFFQVASLDPMRALLTVYPDADVEGPIPLAPHLHAPGKSVGFLNNNRH